VRRALLFSLALGACHTFQDPNVVVDLRVLAMDATFPEQVIDIDLMNPTADPAMVLSQINTTTVCALITDPARDRRLRWSMTLCTFGEGERCDPPTTMIGGGLAEDPDTSKPEPQICANVFPDSNLEDVVLAALDGDQLHGLQGVDYQVQLEVGGEDDDPSLDQFASKTLQLAARVPPDRQANKNPTLDALAATFMDGTSVELPLGRCVDTASPFPIAPATQIILTPVESADAREMYVIPTLDGGSEMFTESLTYQWVATGGKFSTGSTGGPKDPFCNPAPLSTKWTSPKASDLDGPTDISLWVVQRDERFGVTWYESCFEVQPP